MKRLGLLCLLVSVGSMKGMYSYSLLQKPNCTASFVLCIDGKEKSDEASGHPLSCEQVAALFEKPNYQDPAIRVRSLTIKKQRKLLLEWHTAMRTVERTHALTIAKTYEDKTVQEARDLINRFAKN